MLNDEFGLLEDIFWTEDNQGIEEEFPLPQEAYETLLQLSQQTGETPERILYEMITERLNKEGNDISARVYRQNSSYPEFD